MIVVDIEDKTALLVLYLYHLIALDCALTVKNSSLLPCTVKTK